MSDPRGYAELAEYRRQTHEIYAQVRSGEADPEGTWRKFRRQREALFRRHPQSALDASQRQTFDGLPYFDYQPQLRVLAEVEPIEEEKPLSVQLEGDGLTLLRRFGRASFTLHGERAALTLFWIEGYGGGVFLPFRDATSGDETYAGGRYLLDTIKGADLGRVGDAWVLDFNYAYNPSCAYNAKWSCPLAPLENWLGVLLRAGEKNYPDAV